MVGETLGQYRIAARLGAGGMGVAYRAHDEKQHRTVAITVVGAGVSTDGKQVALTVADQNSRLRSSRTENG